MRSSLASGDSPWHLPSNAISSSRIIRCQHALTRSFERGMSTTLLGLLDNIDMPKWEWCLIRTVIENWDKNRELLFTSSTPSPNFQRETPCLNWSHLIQRIPNSELKCIIIVVAVVVVVFVILRCQYLTGLVTHELGRIWKEAVMT